MLTIIGLISVFLAGLLLGLCYPYFNSAPKMRELYRSPIVPPKDEKCKNCGCGHKYRAHYCNGALVHGEL